MRNKIGIKKKIRDKEWRKKRMKNGKRLEREKNKNEEKKMKKCKER